MNMFGELKHNFSNFISELLLQPDKKADIDDIHDKLKEVFSRKNNDNNDISLNTLSEAFLTISSTDFEEYQNLKIKESQRFLELKEAQYQLSVLESKVKLLKDKQTLLEKKINSENEPHNETESFITNANLDGNLQGMINNMTLSEMLIHLENVKEEKIKEKRKIKKQEQAIEHIENDLQELANQISTFEDENGISTAKITDAFLLECDPPIHIDENNLPQDPFTWFYYAMVVIFNIPSVLIKYIAKSFYRIVTDEDPNNTSSQNDIEIIRKFMVEFSYILLTFWLTFNVLFFSMKPGLLKSTGPWTNFNWVNIGFIKTILIVLYFPTEFIIRLFTKNLNPSLESIGIDKYPPLCYIWVFFISMFFVFNYLSEFRSWFFNSLITPSQFPKASGIITLLLVFKYLSESFGGLVKTLNWAMSFIGSLMTFIFVIIIVHMFAGGAQFVFCLMISFYLLGPFFIKEGGISQIDSIYNNFSGATGKLYFPFIGKLSEFIGEYMVHTVNKKTPMSTFFFCILLLFFIYRFTFVSVSNHPNVKLFTVLGNSIGIIYCLISIIRAQQTKNNVNSNNRLYDYSINIM